MTSKKNVVLLHCKRTPFGHQKDYICYAKGLHLKRKRTPFAKRQQFPTATASEYPTPQ